MMICISLVTVELDKCEWIQEGKGKIVKRQEFVGEEKEMISLPGI